LEVQGQVPDDRNFEMINDGQVTSFFYSGTSFIFHNLAFSDAGHYVVGGEFPKSDLLRRDA
jgi:hypothetical protein